MNNFISTFEELGKLYESAALQEADDELFDVEETEEVPAEDTPVEDAPVEEPSTEEDTEEAPKQLALECAKCGAVIIKAEEDVQIDEATDLANVDDACAYCEAADGFKVVGVVVPYDDEDIEIEDDEEDLEEGIFDFGKKKKEKEAAAAKQAEEEKARREANKKKFDELQRAYERADIDNQRDTWKKEQEERDAKRAYERSRYNSIKADKPSNTGYTGVNYSGGDYY